MFNCIFCLVNTVVHLGPCIDAEEIKSGRKRRSSDDQESYIEGAAALASEISSKCMKILRDCRDETIIPSEGVQCCTVEWPNGQIDRVQFNDNCERQAFDCQYQTSKIKMTII